MSLFVETAKITHNLELIVYVNGSKLSPWTSGGASDTWPGVKGLTIQKSLESPVPVLTVDVSSLPTSIQRGMRVEVDLGYNGLFRRVFTGNVQSRERAIGDNRLQCLGKLYALFRTIEVTQRNIDGLTVQAAIEGILDYVGISSSGRSLTIPDFTLGSASTPILERMQASQMVQTIMDVEGLRIYETGTGQVIIRKFGIAPAAVAFRQYSTDAVATARIIDGSDREDPEFVRTRVTVTGATVVEGTPPDETSRTISATASLINPGLLVQPPLPASTFIDADVSNHLIDTDDKASEVAARLLTEYSQIPRQITLEIPGDPELELGHTVEVTLPEFGVDGFWFIYGLEHIVDESGFITRLDLRGGDSVPITIGINPIPDFFFTIDRQILGDRVFAFVTFDASASHDPDGSIASYAWSDDEVTLPEIAGLTDSQVTVRIDPGVITGTWDVTLTVTDDDGLTGAVTKSISVAESDALVIIPAIFAAINNNASATPDGGQNWDEQAGSTCVVVGARPSHLLGVDAGVAIFGFTDGSLKRTDNFCRTALTTVLSGAGSRFVSIKFSPNINVVLALTEQGKLYISHNVGLTWSVFIEFRTRLGLSSAIFRAMTTTVNGITVVGGDGIGNPLMVKVGGGVHQVTLGGDIDTDHPGIAALRIKDFAERPFNRIAIIIENATGGGGSQEAIYYNANIANPAGWTRATGLGAATNGEFIVPTFTLNRFLAGFQDRDIWVTQDGIAYVQRTDVLPANHRPNHALWLKDQELDIDLPGVYLMALEDTVGQTGGIYKSTDEMVTVQAVRPATGFDAWPASATGQQVAIGGSDLIHQSGRLLLAVTLIFPDRGAAHRLDVADFTKTVLATELTDSVLLIPRATNDQVWFIFGFSFAKDYNDSNVIRTKDAGATWSTYTQPKSGDDWWQDICRAADGRLWGVTLDVTSEILGISKTWYSDDDGDSWTLSRTQTDAPTDNRRLFAIICHPTNPNIIAMCGYGGGGAQGDRVAVDYTLNRGDSWTYNQNTVDGRAISPLGHEDGFVMLASGRICAHLTVAADIDTFLTFTDDFGASWVIAKDFGLGTQHRIPGPPVTNGSNIVMALEFDTSGSPALSQVWVSINGGRSYIALDNPIPRPSASYIYRGGMAYDPIENAIYVVGEGLRSTNDFLIMKISPITQAGTWQDVSDQLLPFGALSEYEIIDRGNHLAIIPRAAG